MKKIYLVCTQLCLFLGVSAQVPKSGDVSIGSLAPEFTFEEVVNVPGGRISSENLKGKKVILDFWAPYCIPCVQALPKMHELQDRFGEDLQIILIGLGGRDRIHSFLERRKAQGMPVELPVAIDSTVYKQFGLNGIPHYVWIDDQGVTQAITSQDVVNVDNVQRFISGKPLSLQPRPKGDIDYDIQKPLLIDGNGGGADAIRYHSILTGFIDTKKSGMYTPPRNGKISALNKSMVGLFRIAYADKNGGLPIPITRVVLDVKHPETFDSRYSDDDYDLWSIQHTYCYELIVPEEKSEQLLPIMQGELKHLFDIEAEMEEQTVKCLIMVKNRNVGQCLLTKGGTPFQNWDINGVEITNKPFKTFFGMIQYYNQLHILLDETGIERNVDIGLNVSMNDLDALKIALGEYGLDIIEADRKVKMLVLRDAHR